MKKLLILTVLVSLVTLFAFRTGEKTCLMMSARGLQAQKAWYADLKLTGDQKKSLGDLETAFRDKADSLCMKVCKQKQNLLDQLSDPAADPKLAKQKIEEIGALQTALEKEVVSHIFNVRGLLRPEQRKTYHERIQREFQKALASTQCAMGKR